MALYPDRQPGEIFVIMAKEGSTLAGMMDSFAISASLALQHGVPLMVTPSPRRTAWMCAVIPDDNTFLECADKAGADCLCRGKRVRLQRRPLPAHLAIILTLPARRRLSFSHF